MQHLKVYTCHSILLKRKGYPEVNCQNAIVILKAYLAGLEGKFIFSVTL
ncbi:hypothetical protein ANT_18800 [Anaerolinea thermophila UNI-1]|uniref:Uncharacterized protein n=1 Tax=Anaerolinea thermophila (strain DSM 14523 / JCM 11388 / NBRC 100420 / UNI-1) TaxID=926569 RepID=E8N642_ANATU|nr:hypothetical protein ANT_18800 [Anaerolinea thermophila UNI-1]